MRKLTLLMVILFLFSKNIFAQMPSAEERSVQLSATVQTTPPQIHLTWKADPTASKYVVYRKSLEADTWGMALDTLAGTATDFLDTNVEVGIGYEYAFFKEDFAPRIDTVCVDAGTEVNFAVNDMYNIGLCCSFGFGKYQIDNCGTIQATGSDFGTTASHIFTVCDNGQGCSDVVITLKTDMFENSTSWILKNNSTGATIATSGAVGSFVKPRPEYGFIYAGIELSPVEERGKILLLVENSLSTPLFDEIEQLKMDFIADGWQVLKENVDANDSPNNVRTLVQSLYSAHNDLKSVFILGHVPIAYSGDIFPDTHSELRGAYPADVYYGEMNGTWTDQMVNNTSANFAIYHNTPTDGRFDQDSIPTGEVELAVGRVDFFDMPAFGSSNETLIQNYLQKNHAFKTRQINPTRRALIDDNFMQTFAAPAASGFRNFATMFGADNIHQVDYFSTMENESYLWSYGCGGGSIVSSQGIGTTNDFANSNLQSVFTMLFGSQFGNWAYPDNFLRAPLASGQTLTNVWAGSPPWTLHHMAMGFPIGYSTLKTQNGNSGLYLGNGPQLVHVALMGDPTLRMHMVAPPSNITFTENAYSIDLTWNTPLDETVFGYHIYRADALDGKFERINSNPITDLSFTDNAPKDGENWYMVRTLKLENSASGSYFNLSLGKIDSVNFTPAAPLMASFSSNTQEGCVGDTIFYNNTSTGVIESYIWTFQEGFPTTSDVPNPEIKYNLEGTFDVSLTISNLPEIAVEIKNEYLIIKDKPTPNFTYSIDDGSISIIDNSINADVYSWDFGDGTISQAIGNVTHIYSTSGNYTIVLTTSNECGMDSFETTINVTITDLENLEIENSISIYPNPVSAFLNIDFLEKTKDDYSLQIFNTLGQMVFSKKIKSNIELEKVEAGDFPKGIYFVKIGGEKIKMVKRIVVD